MLINKLPPPSNDWTGVEWYPKRGFAENLVSEARFRRKASRAYVLRFNLHPLLINTPPPFPAAGLHETQIRFNLHSLLIYTPSCKGCTRTHQAASSPQSSHSVFAPSELVFPAASHRAFCYSIVYIKTVKKTKSVKINFTCLRLV